MGIERVLYTHIVVWWLLCVCLGWYPAHHSRIFRLLYDDMNLQKKRRKKYHRVNVIGVEADENYVATTAPSKYCVRRLMLQPKMKLLKKQEKNNVAHNQNYTQTVNVKERERERDFCVV